MGKTVYCTISSANFLSRVYALRDSLKRYNPEADLRILLVEKPEVVKQLNQLLGETFYAPDEIDCKDWHQMAFYYDIIEFNTALKPYLIDKIFRKKVDDVEKVLYFDADIMFYAGTQELEKQLDQDDILMTPHLSQPNDENVHILSEWSNIAGGQFNMGFLGFKRTPNVFQILDWWKEKLRTECIYDIKRHLYTDQWWGQLFVSFEDKCKILRSESYNMAWWNISQRHLRFENGNYFTHDGPLVFFHFSSLSRTDPGWIANPQRKVRFAEDSEQYKIVSRYIDIVKTFENDQYSNLPYSFGQYQNQKRISGFERKLYHQILTKGEKLVEDPFNEKQFRKFVGQKYRLLPAKDILLDIFGNRLGGYRILDKLKKSI